MAAAAAVGAAAAAPAAAESQPVFQRMASFAATIQGVHKLIDSQPSQKGPKGRDDRHRQLE